MRYQNQDRRSSKRHVSFRITVLHCVLKIQQTPVIDWRLLLFMKVLSLHYRFQIRCKITAASARVSESCGAILPFLPFTIPDFTKAATLSMA